MKVQVFNNARMGTTLVSEGIRGYIPFGFSPKIIMSKVEDVKQLLPAFKTYDDESYAPVGDAVAEFEV